MKGKNLTIPEIVLLSSTRAALGAGVGLLVSGKLNRDFRKGAGWALLALGAVSSIPIVWEIANKPQTVNA